MHANQILCNSELRAICWYYCNLLTNNSSLVSKTVGWQSWMSLLSDAHAYVKMAHRARPLSRANSNFRFTFALHKGVRTQSFQITESWQSRINAHLAGMCSAASALRNNTSGEPCAIRYALEMAQRRCLPILLSCFYIMVTVVGSCGPTCGWAQAPKAVVVSHVAWNPAASQWMLGS